MSKKSSVKTSQESVHSDVDKCAIDQSSCNKYDTFDEPHWDEGYSFTSSYSSNYSDRSSDYDMDTSEEDKDDEDFFRDNRPSETKHKAHKFATIQQGQEIRRKSLFVHGSPTQFPDINRIRSSAFGSIFLRTTGNISEEIALLKSTSDNNSYMMMQSLLTTFEKIITSPLTDDDRRCRATQNKESLIKKLESHGVIKSYSDGSIVWNVYPIAHNYLFSLQIGDHIHESRHLSKIEQRILTGHSRKQRLPYEWPTDSVWTGSWDAMGMAGNGTYIMPHGVLFNGMMQDGMFNDSDAMLTYPNQFKALHCVYNNGVLQECQFQYPDMLMHEKENWGYCTFPDRRFWSEVRRGLKPAKLAQKSELDPPRAVPRNYYDTGDGFYDPKSLMLVNENRDLLRVPMCKEDQWIRKHCRHGFFEYANFRPDLFENWLDYDYHVIQMIMKQQHNYRHKKITYDELQQFYADLNLLPPWSKYKKKKSPSEIELEEKFKAIPDPLELKERKVKKYKGHCLAEELKLMLKKEKEVEGRKTTGTSTTESSTSFEAQTSKKTPVQSAKFVQIDTVVTPFGAPREVPEKFLQFQPVLRQAFETAPPLLPRTPKPKAPKKCVSRASSSTSSEIVMHPEESFIKMNLTERKGLERHFRKLIMEVVNDIVEKERDRDLKRLKWAKVPTAKRKPESKPTTPTEKCMKVLQELFSSIPEKDEYCDSDPKKVLDLKEIAEDKFNLVQYWGTRIFQLEFSDAD